MSAVVSLRVEADPKAKLPPGAAEAWFAWHMAKAIRKGMDEPVKVIEPAREQLSSVPMLGKPAEAAKINDRLSDQFIAETLSKPAWTLRGELKVAARVAAEAKSPKRTRMDYGFGAFEIGDTIVVGSGNAKSAVVCACVYGKRHGMKFRSRKDGDGVRIERVA